MFYFYSALAAIIPMLIYLIIVVRLDRYEERFVKKILLSYAFGGVGAAFFSFLGSGFITTGLSYLISNQENLKITEIVLVAPFVEELTKGIFLLIILSYKSFDNITDGIIYGCAIGLAFGMTENFLYFITYGTNFNDWISLVIIRTFFSAVMHSTATALLGAFIGYSKLKSLFYKFTFPFLGLGLAMLIHITWNFNVSFNPSPVLGFIFILFLIIFFLTTLAFAVTKEKKIIFNELYEEAQGGLMPIYHLKILNTSDRNKMGWVDESVRKLYINAAASLAFRKMQLKNCTEKDKIIYTNDVEHFRNYIQNLLSNSFSI